MASDLSPRIPDFALTHAQARWLLSVLYGGTGRPDMDTAFDAYLKYLRREGLPFAANELGVGRGNRMRYGYPHLMELAVALYLKSQAILPKQVVSVLASLRDKLRPIYERAYLEACIKRSSGNVAVAARLAGRNRTDFYDLLRRHGLSPTQFKNG